MKDKHRKKQAGFTLIELLVVMFIISLLSGSVLIGYWGGQKRYDVSRAAQQMLADLRRAQNLALSGKMQMAVSPAGYGIYVSAADRYTLFYNTNSARRHDGASLDMEQVSLPANVKLAPVGTSVYFTPPAPVTYINGASVGSVVFTLTNASYSKTITVYASGRIE
jgi:prepilin-type N-terminal cleavage/methylation domain-containing protein